MEELIRLRKLELELEELQKQNKRLQATNTFLLSENKALSKLAFSDPLSTLYNRRAMQAAITKISGDIYSIVMCDIDNFKDINDTYGHQSGDIVIKKIGEIIKENERKEDFAVRYGGDEFLIIFKDCSVENAKNKCQLLSHQVSEKFQDLFGFPITLSFGISYCGEEGKFEQTKNEADEALYHSKDMGKNCITTYDEIKDKGINRV